MLLRCDVRDIVSSQGLVLVRDGAPTCRVQTPAGAVRRGNPLARSEPKLHQMARSASNQSIAHVIDESVRSVVAGVLPSLQRALNAAVDGRVRAELASRKIPRGRRAPSRRAGEITRWVADNRAPRAPTFVIEATRLDTKRKIIAKYGPNAASAKGKSFPPVKLATAMPAEQSHKGEVKAKPPVIRKAAAATKWQSVPKE